LDIETSFGVEKITQNNFPCIISFISHEKYKRTKDKHIRAIGIAVHIFIFNGVRAKLETSNSIIRAL